MDILLSVWPFAIGVLAIVAPIAVTLHAVLGRRDTGTIISWVALAWLVPIFGSLIYYAFGINRIGRRAAALKVRGGKISPAAAQMSADDHRIRDDLLEISPQLGGLVRLGSKVTQQPLLAGNSVEPLINGDEAYPAMLEAIGAARHSVSLLSYIFDYDSVGKEFLAALREAKSRGVEVRVLIDHLGSRYSRPTMVSRLQREGIRVEAFLKTLVPRSLSYANLRNHRKILVVDGHVGFTGGTNIREAHDLSRNPAVPVQCLHFRLGGPIVADLQRIFAIDWAFVCGEALGGADWFPALERTGAVAARGVSDGPDEDLDHILEVLLGALAVASHRVRIVTPYFLPDAVVQRALQITALRGIAVDILIPRTSNIPVVSWATTPLLEPLLESGCRVYYSREPFDHTKLMVVDDCWSLIGSTNWDARSLRLNFEFNVECYSQILAQEFASIIDAKIEASRELTLGQLRGRSFPIRLRDGLARLATPYL